MKDLTRLWNSTGIGFCMVPLAARLKMLPSSGRKAVPGWARAPYAKSNVEIEYDFGGKRLQSRQGRLGRRRRVNIVKGKEGRQ